MHNVLVTLFVVSLLLLVAVIFRTTAFRWIILIAINIVSAAILLYLVNAMGIYASLQIPINFVTLLVTGVLGIPGLLLLTAVKLTLL